MTLEILWFCLLAFFWTAYFVLEGFDFGVGMLLPVLGRSEGDRGMMFESIGPLWDGNEVWLVIAGGATFAAFPVWYATMFSGFYLALLLILGLLIVRVLSFEWREKAHGRAWKGFWAWMNTIGSIGAPFVWGVALASLLHGTPIASDQTFAGDFGDLFSAYSIVAGIAVCLLFALHGAVFLTLRTLGDLRERSRRTASRLAPAAAIVGAGFLVWTLVVAGDVNDKGAVPGHPPRRGGGDRGRRGGLPRPGGQRAVGVRRHGDDDRRGRRHPLRQPLSARDGVGPRVREQPHDRQRLLGALLAHRDDGRRGRSPPGRAALHRVDVSRLPREARR